MWTACAGRQRSYLVAECHMQQRLGRRTALAHLALSSTRQGRTHVTAGQRALARRLPHMRPRCLALSWINPEPPLLH